MKRFRAGFVFKDATEQLVCGTGWVVLCCVVGFMFTVFIFRSYFPLQKMTAL